MKARRLIGMLAAVLAFAALMVAVAAPASADPLPPAKGNLVIHKYVNDGGSYGTNDGTELTGAAIPSSEPINGVSFDIYKITGVPAGGMIYKLNGSTLEVYDGINSAPVTTYPVVKVDSETTVGQGEATASNLDQGYYLVIENADNSTPIGVFSGKPVTISMVSAPFVVAVPMTNPDGDGWLTTVHVYPKNQTMGITKEVSVPAGDAVAVGDTISYTIKSTIPTDIATGKRYVITDALDSALTPDIGSVVVTPLQGGSPLTVNTDYTVAVDANNVLTVTMVPKESTPPALGNMLEGYEQVQVTFDVTINANILNKQGYAVKNDAKVNFTNQDGTDYEANTGDDGPTIHTAAIQITKVDDHGQALNGAKFCIATSEQNAKDGNFLRIDGNSQLWDVGTSGYATATDYVLEPNNVANFTGLRDVASGVAQNYWIVEVAAPQGYNLLTAPIELSFTGSEANHTLIAPSVVNNLGFVLPVTGGTGTMLFTVAGIILIGLAAIIVITRKRKASINKQ